MESFFWSHFDKSMFLKRFTYCMFMNQKERETLCLIETKTHMNVSLNIFYLR